MARFLTVPDNANNVDILTPSGVLLCTTSAGGGGGGSVNSVTGTGGAPLETVNNADPTNPVITWQASEYLGELVRGNGSGGWERATNGVVAATTINSRPGDAAAVIELVSGTGHVHLGQDVAEVLSPTGQDLLLAASLNKRNHLQVTGATAGRADAIVAQVFNDGSDHVQLGFFGTTPQSQTSVGSATNPSDALNTLLGILNANGLVGSVPTTVDSKILGFWGALSANAATSVQWLDFGNVRDTAHPTSDASSAMVQPVQGTLTGIYVRHSSALTTDSVTYTVQKNGVDTALVVTIAANATAGNFAANVAFAAGDRIGVKCVQSGTQANAALGASVGLAYKSP